MEGIVEESHQIGKLDVAVPGNASQKPIQQGPVPVTDGVVPGKRRHLLLCDGVAEYRSQQRYLAVSFHPQQTVLSPVLQCEDPHGFTLGLDKRFHCQGDFPVDIQRLVQRGYHLLLLSFPKQRQRHIVASIELLEEPFRVHTPFTS